MPNTVGSKYHVFLNDKGYIISQRGGKKYYQKKRSPAFVNKFGGGDSSYRDATFWQYFVQTNWRNGSKQLKFDDAGKFWKSSDVDTTTLEQLTISKSLVNAGQLAPNIKVNCIEAWRADAVNAFGDGSDGALTISADTTETVVDSACTGTSGTTSLTATNAGFSANQKILIVQMDGANAGKYEVNTIGGYTAGTITTSSPLINTYAAKAQVRVIKQQSAVTIDASKTYTAKAWDGTVGGILSFLCTGAVTVNGSINATGKGFRGGAGGTAIGGDTGNNGTEGEGTGGAGVANIVANGNGGGGGHYAQSGVYNPGPGAGGGNGAVGTDGASSPDNLKAVGGSISGSDTLSTMTPGGGGGGGGGKNTNGGAGGNGGGIIYIYGKTFTMNVGSSIVSGGNGGAGGSGGANDSNGDPGGGGAGGSILIKAQTATLGTALITAPAGAKGSPDNHQGAAGAGSVGRIALNYSASYSGTTTPTFTGTTDSSLADVAASNTSTAYAGADDGKIYSWDGATTWTEVFDTRQLEWFDAGTDADLLVGDDGGTEKAEAQSFQVDATTKVKSIKVYLKKATGTPGDITVRIETNNSTVPSGTLVNANAAATIPAFTSTSYAWITVDFSTNFSLTGSTTYWLVLKTAAAANDNNYKWAGKSTSGYGAGNNANSTDGGGTWAADTKDAYFKVLGNTTSVNCSLISKISTSKKMYFGTGNPTGTETADARIISFDGTTWAINKIFASASECVVSTMTEYSDSKVYIGVGAQAKVYSTADFTTFTVSKDIDIPQNPGYIYALKEYNSYLFAGGGSPELVPTQYYNGFMNYYDQTTWRILYPFDFTVMKSLEFYDAYLFMGTYHGQLYVYDTSTLNPLFNFKDQYDYKVQIYAMKYFDDKLYLGLYPQDGSGDTNAGVWIFERHGLYNAHTVSGVTGYRCMGVVNGELLVGTGDDGYVYKLSTTVYKTQGWYQSSYFDANLPSIDKLYNGVTVKHDALASGQSVVVYYRYAETSNWTTLGTSDTVASTEKVLAFPTATYSKKITLKVELNTTTTTASPKLTEVIMQYSLYPPLRWQWSLRLLAKKSLTLLDKTTETRSSSTLRGELEALMDSQTLYQFVDIDNTTYNVLVNDIDQNSWVINESDVNEDEIVLSLLEA